jgi:hypothetical protein
MPLGVREGKQESGPSTEEETEVGALSSLPQEAREGGEQGKAQVSVQYARLSSSSLQP